MCVNPNLIRNPNYGCASKNKFSHLKDCTSEYIYVPCGHCPECVAVRQMSFVQRVQMETLKNHVFYTTLTYQEKYLPRLECVDNNGELHSIRYGDLSDVVKMIKRLRKKKLFPRAGTRYFAVSELGSSKGRPHFHILWFVPKEKGDTFCDCLNLEKSLFDTILSNWTRNIGSRKFPNYVPLCRYVCYWSNGKLKYNYDTHYVNPSLSDNGEADVAFYCLKYMLKPSDRATRLQQALHLNLDEDEYKRVWSIVKPRHFESLDFGLSKCPDVQAHLRKGVELGLQAFDYPVYINPDSGATFPLSRYYKSKADIFSYDDAEKFFIKSHLNDDDLPIDNYVPADYPDFVESSSIYKKHDKRLSYIDSHLEDFNDEI